MAWDSPNTQSLQVLQTDLDREACTQRLSSRLALSRRQEILLNLFVDVHKAFC